MRAPVTDEFEVRGYTDDEGERGGTWTRATLAASMAFAEELVARHGYRRAEVRNTYGGHRSDVLYGLQATDGEAYRVTESRGRAVHAAMARNPWRAVRP